MIEVIGDIWKAHYDDIPICITVNTTLNNEGNAIMGKGIALEARELYPELPKIWARLMPGVKYFNPYNLFFFPTKTDWYKKSTLDLIESSCIELVDLVKYRDMKEVALPWPGCGNGGLTKQLVRPILEKYLNDKYLVYSKTV